MRDSFVKASNESCVKTASTPQNLKVLTPAMIDAACSCITDKVADRIKGPEILAAIRGQLSEDTQAYMREVTPACLTEAVR